MRGHATGQPAPPWQFSLGLKTCSRFPLRLPFRPPQTLLSPSIRGGAALSSRE
jgi:hypothetical protein